MKLNIVINEFELTEAKGDGDKYEKFMKKKLKQWKIKSPQELSTKDKKKFFKEIEDEWTDEDPKTNDKDR